MADQRFEVYLSFKDDATGKFVKATDEMINSVKKFGVESKKQGNAVAVDFEKMAKGMNETGRSGRLLGFEISKLQASIGSLRNQILVYMFAFRPLINLTKESISSAIEQEQATMRLSAAFVATGKGSRQTVADIEAYASSLQGLTGYQDEEITAAAAMLANMKLSASQVKQSLPLVLDMTAALKAGGDANASLTGTAKILGRALQGNASMLERMGVHLSETSKKTKDLNSIFSDIQSSVGGAAQTMATTFKGQFDIMNASLDDFKESLGNIVIKSPMVVAALNLMSDEFKNMKGNLDSSAEATNNWANSWDRVARFLISLGMQISLVWNGVTEIFRFFAITVIGVMEAFVAVLHAAISVVNGFFTLFKNTPLGGLIKKDTENAKQSLEKFAEFLKNTNAGIQEDYVNTGRGMGDSFEIAANTYEKWRIKADEIQVKMLEGVKGLSKEVEDTTENLGKQLEITTTYMTAFATGARDALVNGFFKIIHGEFDSLMDVVSDFGDMLLKTLLQIGVNAALIKVGLGSYLGFSGISAHTGMYVLNGNDSAGYPRRKFHSGGEVSATLLEGEGVLNKTAMNNLGVDNLNKLNRGEQAGGGGVTNVYYINAIDAKSLEDVLREHGDIYANAAEASIRDNGSMRTTGRRYL